VSVFLIGCGGHTKLDCVWLAGQCWGCKGNHKYKDCTRKNGKARTVHTVQQAETVEGMGSRMSRIYAALDNKQA
jgi:hypothetical protein